MVGWIFDIVLKQIPILYLFLYYEKFDIYFCFKRNEILLLCYIVHVTLYVFKSKLIFFNMVAISRTYNNVILILNFSVYLEHCSLRTKLILQHPGITGF